jgi:predicted RNA-binding protein associated with RNAse of E/G family
MANKFSVEFALDNGIEGFKKRNGNPEELYKDVQESLKTEKSEEMKDLYRRYITLYESYAKEVAIKKDVVLDNARASRDTVAEEIQPLSLQK